MTRLTTTLMIAAASFVAAAGNASAQTMKAEIPFSFRAAGTLMQPGTYEIKKTVTPGAAPYISVRSEENGKGVLITQIIGADTPKEWMASGAPRAMFECAGERCVLREVWAGAGSTAYRIHAPKLEGDEPVRTAEIRLSVVKAD